MKIYQNVHRVNATPDQIFTLLEDDFFIIQNFSLLDSITYDTHSRRNTGTKLIMKLTLAGKSYRLRNKIIRYEVPSTIIVESYVRKRTLMHQLVIISVNGRSDIQISSVLNNPSSRMKQTMRLLQPLISLALKRSIHQFIKKIEAHTHV